MKPGLAATRGGAGLAWLGLFVGTLGLASLVAPLAYALFGLFPATSHWPYSRVFNRTAMLLAALFLWRFRAHLGWDRLPDLLKASSRSRAIADLVLGFLASLAGAALAVATAVALGSLGAAEAPYQLFAARTATTLVGAAFAALLEESFFRGMMHSTLAPRLGAMRAAVVTSSVYALVHLLVSDPSLGRQTFRVVAGLTYVGRALGRQLEPAAGLPLLGLFLLGLVLTAVVRLSGNLFTAIGLHAGWALSFQILRHATRPLEGIPGRSFLATHYFLVGTPWAWGGILASGLIAGLWLRGRRGSP